MFRGITTNIFALALMLGGCGARGPLLPPPSHPASPAAAAAPLPVESTVLKNEALDLVADDDDQPPIAGHAHRHGEAAAVAPYHCPMHPEVQSDGPGSCPKCGMRLERATP